MDASVEAGDLVAFEAGVVADGYSGEVGRTWPVGSNGNAAAVENLYRRWDRLWQRLLDACRPGATASDLLEAYRSAGEPLPVRPIAHGLGLGFDDPVVARDLPQTASKESLDPGVVLVLNARVDDDTVGSVTSHEPILITADGPELLSCSPYWNPDRQGAEA